MVDQKRQDTARAFLREHIGDLSRLDAFYGPHAVHLRSVAIELMSGVAVPHRKAGWTAFRKTLLDGFGISGNCIADEDDKLAAFIRGE